MLLKKSQNPQINTGSSHPEVFCQKKRCSQKFCKIRRKHLLRGLSFNKVVGWKPETFRSSRWRCSVKQGDLKISAIFTGNNLCWSLFLINLHFWGLQLCQRRLWHRWFPVKFAIILKNICEAPSIWCSYGNQVETSLWSCGHTCTNLGIASERKGRTEKLLKGGVGKFSFYVMVDYQILTYRKNKK